MKRIFTFLLLLFCIAGCSTASNSTPVVSPQDIANQVGARYGDPHPHVDRVVKTRSDNKQEPMYLITISGHFHKGDLVANSMGFSALQNGKQVWALQTIDAPQAGWVEDEVKLP